MSRPLTKQESDLIGRFGKSTIRADSKQNTATVLTPGRRTAVVLKLGKLYGFQNQSQPYVAFLTNIEFISDHHGKTLFSITVDVYHSNGTLYKPNVYFYNLSLIQKRDERFPLKKDTVTNNFEFWTTLDDNNDIETAFPHHSEIEYFRAALPALSSKRKPSKNCRLNLRLSEAARTTLKDLDHLKQKMQLPNVIADDHNKLTTIYGIQKNTPMKPLLTVRRGYNVRNDQLVKSIVHDFLTDKTPVPPTVPSTSTARATPGPTSPPNAYCAVSVRNWLDQRTDSRVKRPKLAKVNEPTYQEYLKFIEDEGFDDSSEVDACLQYFGVSIPTDPAPTPHGGGAPMRKKTRRLRRRLNRSEKII
jgi:hypothetical protein